jgi:hypothetical protein
VLEGWKKAASRIGPADVLRAVDLLGEALVKLREGREERLMVELAMVRLTRPETAADPEALIVRLERLESRAVGSPTPISESRLPMSTTGPQGAARTAEVVREPEAGPSRVSTPEPSSASDSVSSERLNEIWPALFGGLRQVLGARRWALFREATPAGVEGSRLVLHVAQDFHLEGLQRDQAVTALVATQASDLLGTVVTVEFRKSGVGPTEGGQSSDESLTQVELDKDRLFEAPAETLDPTSLLERELGATLVEEIPVD